MSRISFVAGANGCSNPAPNSVMSGMRISQERAEPATMITEIR